MRTAPNESIEVDEVTGERKLVDYRSESEAGSSWATPAETLEAQSLLKLRLHFREDVSYQSSVLNSLATTNISSVSSEKSTSNILLDISSKHLGHCWTKLVVRVMSARNHDFGSAIANSFYKQEVPS